MLKDLIYTMLIDNIKDFELNVIKYRIYMRCVLKYKCRKS